MFSSFFKSKLITDFSFQVDIHSHLLPDLDDGVHSIRETMYILKIMKHLGYHKVITTPHVMSDQYPNTRKDILDKLNQVRSEIKHENIGVELDAAAEYYLDENFIQAIKTGEELLTFGNNYLLFETSFFNKPAFLEEAIFNMNSQGYRPVLAHPERYSYLHEDTRLIGKLNIVLQFV